MSNIPLRCSTGYSWLLFQGASWKPCGPLQASWLTKAPSWTFFEHSTQLNESLRIGQGMTGIKGFYGWIKWCTVEGEKAKRMCSLVVFFRHEAEDKFPDAQEVDHLGDTEQRCDDQGSTIRPLQESWRAFVAHDFPGEQRKKERKFIKYLQHLSRSRERILVSTQDLSSLDTMGSPYAVSHSTVCVFCASSVQGLQSGLYYCKTMS